VDVDDETAQSSSGRDAAADVAARRHARRDRRFPADEGGPARPEARQMVSDATTAVVPKRNRTAATTDAAAGRSSWLLCRTGTLLCAIPLEHVVEILRVLPIEAVSQAPPYVRGLCIIRGVPVPVVDTGLLVGDQPTKSERLVTIRTGSRTVALAAETVLGIWAIGGESFQELPPLLRDAARDAIAAIGTLDAELLFFLRTTRIVPQELLDRLGPDGAAS
jgi:purine-binding chemotaxis protein CheW